MMRNLLVLIIIIIVIVIIASIARILNVIVRWRLHGNAKFIFSNLTLIVIIQRKGNGIRNLSTQLSIGRDWRQMSVIRLLFLATVYQSNVIEGHQFIVQMNFDNCSHFLGTIAALVNDLVLFLKPSGRFFIADANTSASLGMILWSSLVILEMPLASLPDSLDHFILF